MRETFYVSGILEEKGLEMLVIKSVRYDVCSLTDKRNGKRRNNMHRVRGRDLQPQATRTYVHIDLTVPRTYLDVCMLLKQSPLNGFSSKCKYFRRLTEGLQQKHAEFTLSFESKKEIF